MPTSLAAHNRVLNQSPSTYILPQERIADQYAGSSVPIKKKITLNGGGSQAQLPSSQSPIQVSGSGAQNYKRVVNIYSSKDYKSKRKSQVSDSRVGLSPAILAGQMIHHGAASPDRDPRHHSRRGQNVGDIQLPEIGISSKQRGGSDARLPKGYSEANSLIRHQQPYK